METDLVAPVDCQRKRQLYQLVQIKIIICNYSEGSAWLGSQQLIANY